MRTRILRYVIFSAFVFANVLPASYAINISVQYAPGTLFYSGIDGTAKAAINQAAADVSEAITTSLNAITTDIYSGSYQSTTATFDWSFNYTNPSTGGQTTISSATIAADTVTVFVGTRSLYGNFLGVGGSGAVGFGVNVSGPIGQAQIAINAAGASSQTGLLRGNGPVIDTIDGMLDFGGGNVFNSSVDYGISYGSLSLDNDKNDNGSPDSPASLDSYWHWNHNTPIDPNSQKNDLYSVALHEILHVLGIGLSDSWSDLTSGTTWNGSEVQAITGSGFNLVDGSGEHIANSVMSTRISDGMPQEVVMDPTIKFGTRKKLTVLDLAFLRDIGYETLTPSLLPADFDGDGDVDGADLATFENGYGVNGSGDADGDGDTDGADFLAWQQQHTGPSPSVAIVPEPTSGCLLALMLVVASCRRHR